LTNEDLKRKNAEKLEVAIQRGQRKYLLLKLINDKGKFFLAKIER